jgi:sugar fermentation stimulation protein A
VAEALDAGVIPALAGYESVRREVRLAEGGSRLDFLLSGHAEAPDCYLEVKNVTAATEAGGAFFPDAVSLRATRHLAELEALARKGFRAAMCFCIQRSDVRWVRPADEIDPVYGRALREAAAAGVELYGLCAEVTPQSVSLVAQVPVRLAD